MKTDAENRKIWNNILSAGMAVILGITPSSYVLAASADTEREYQIGKMQVLFESELKYGSGSLREIQVLHDKATDTVWINPEEFVGELTNYQYDYNKIEKTGEITVWNRQIGLRMGSSISAYKMGDCECLYRMDAPVVKYQDVMWVPANEFFYYLSCDICPIAGDGDATESSNDTGTGINIGTEIMEPKEDYLKVDNPAYTVLDVLYDIFSFDHGAYWSFTYEKDFGLTEKEMKDIASASRFAYENYKILTGNLRTILDAIMEMSVISTGNISAIAELIEEIQHPEILDGDDAIDMLAIEKFVKSMLMISENQFEEINESAKNAVSFYSIYVPLLIEKGLTLLSEQEIDELVRFFQAMEADNVWPVFKGEFDDLVTNTLYKDDFAPVWKGTEVGFKILGGLLTGAVIAQEAKKLDTVVSDAMQMYWEESAKDTELNQNVWDLTNVSYFQQKDEISYQISEAVKAGISDILPEVILADAGTGWIGVVMAMNNISWYAIEKNGLWPYAKVAEPEAFQIAMAGMLYEMDAWRELAFSYEDIAIGNGLTSRDELEEAAYLAVNYLKACYVTTEAALKSLESSGFAKSDTYKKAKTKRRQLTLMLDALTEGIIRDDTTGYGVLLNRSEFSENTLTYELLTNPSKMELKVSYKGYTPKLMAPLAKVLSVTDFEMSYYEYIRDEILPETGFAKQEEQTRTLTQDDHIDSSGTFNLSYIGGWDHREGILSADIEDMNFDEIDDLLLYYVDEEDNDLKVALYTMDENGKICFIEENVIDSIDGNDFTHLAGGIVEIDERRYLYIERFSYGYFVDYSGPSYEIYEYAEDGRFLPKWKIQKTDGGSSEIAYSLLTRIEDEDYEKNILWGDGGFRYFYPVEQIATDEDATLLDAMHIGLKKIGLDGVMKEQTLECGYDWVSCINDSDKVKKSFEYLSVVTDETSRVKNVRTILTDYTNFQEEIEKNTEKEN